MASEGGFYNGLTANQFACCQAARIVEAISKRIDKAEGFSGLAATERAAYNAALNLLANDFEHRTASKAKR